MVMELLLFSFVSSTVEGRLATTFVRMELLVFRRVLAMLPILSFFSPLPKWSLAPGQMIHPLIVV